jgi:hypothetical protein
MRWLSTFLLVAAAACSNKPSKSACEKAADKMLDVFAAPRLGPGSSAPSELNQITDGWRKTLKAGQNPTRQYLIDTCRRKMTGDHVECIGHATNEQSLAKCFSG